MRSPPGNRDNPTVGGFARNVPGPQRHCSHLLHQGETNNGDLGENKGVNLPGVSIALPALAEKDKQDLIFGCEQGVDFVAASFIRKRSDVVEIREHLKAHGGENIQIISKIENQEGLNNFDEILEASDGIMVSRGDMGVEIPVEEVIFAQKMIIEKCIRARKA